MSKEKQSGDCKNCNSHEEKQIEEIEKALSKVQNFGLIVTESQMDSRNSYSREIKNKEVSEALFNAGYRKQVEGEWYVNYMMSKKPSKRGRIIQYTTYTCSVCGKPNGRKKSKFCPNCGAKMKGGAE